MEQETVMGRGEDRRICFFFHIQNLNLKHTHTYVIRDQDG